MNSDTQDQQDESRPLSLQQLGTVEGNLSQTLRASGQRSPGLSLQAPAPPPAEPRSLRPLRYKFRPVGVAGIVAERPIASRVVGGC